MAGTRGLCSILPLVYNLPLVLTGHTFCTVETFDEVAKAIAELAFATSKLPVILSLEQHCSPKQQNMLAKMMVNYIGNALLSVCCNSRSPCAYRTLCHPCEMASRAASQYAELVATGKARSLSPQEVAMRVIVKGKVKLSKTKEPARALRPVPSGSSGSLSPGSPMSVTSGAIRSGPHARRFHVQKSRLRSLALPISTKSTRLTRLSTAAGDRATRRRASTQSPCSSRRRSTWGSAEGGAQSSSTRRSAIDMVRKWGDAESSSSRQSTIEMVRNDFGRTCHHSPHGM